MGDYEREHKPARATKDAAAPARKPLPKDSDGSKPRARGPGEKPKPKQLGETAATSARDKLDPGPLAFDHRVTFVGVSGRETIDKEIRIENTSADERMFYTELAGPAFVRDDDRMGYIGGAASADQTRSVAVRYAPKTAGTHVAKLVVISKAVDEAYHPVDGTSARQEIELVGTATNLEAPHQLAIAGGPEPVHALPDVAIGERDAHRRAQDAIESASSLATTFNQIVIPGDRARDDFAARIAAEGGELDAKIIEWLTGEGIFEMKAGAHQEGLDELATSMFMKVLEAGGEHLHLGGSVLSAASFVIELGLAVHSANKKNREEAERQNQFSESMERLGTHAAGAARSSTELLMHHFGGLMSEYGGARASLAAVVEQSSKVLAALTQNEGSADRVQRFYDEVRTTTVAFERAMQRYADSLRALAGAAGSIHDRLERGFDQMRDRYLRERASGRKPTDAPAVAKLELVADWDLGDPAYDRRPSITLLGAQFGNYGKMSSDMRSFATSKSLSELSEMDVVLRLHCVQDGREITVEQKAGQEPRFLELAGHASWVAITLGPRRILQIVGGTSLRSRTIELGR